MDYTLVLLISVFHVLSVGTGAPLEGGSVESEQIKQKVEKYANLLIARIVRLNLNYQNTSHETLEPSIKELEGPSSIVTVLKGYNDLISDSLEGVTQIKTELYILTNSTDEWSQQHCKQPTKSSEPELLKKLQKLKRFTHTVGTKALMRVKEYLSLLRRNLDLLDIC
ncbi:leptin [Kryptolebias marmoratus]|uniref:Leptin-like n=1 Tax=Kryptolebias marmoratus TaxID=37003 RepID=A0A3Q3ANM6_KRYMA|nr:leptin [Kryptolebias marmoratus]